MYRKSTDNARHTNHEWENMAGGSGDEEPETNSAVGDVPGPLEWGAWTKPWQPSPTWQAGIQQPSTWLSPRYWD